jgi:putative ABC transport system ATP-binding protein
LLADEPTGNLDSENGARVMDLLRELNTDLGITILMATHAPDIASSAHRVIRLRDGRIASGAQAQGVEEAAGAAHDEGS